LRCCGGLKNYRGADSDSALQRKKWRRLNVSYENDKANVKLLKKRAMEYHRTLGLAIVLFNFWKANGEWKKKTLVRWKKFKDEGQTREEFEALPWDNPNVTGFAVISGKTPHGYFCAIEYDVKGATAKVKELGKKVMSSLPETAQGSTINKGYRNFYYSKKEPKTNSKFRDTCAVELLGSGKLIIVAPSFGYKSTNNKNARVVDDVSEIFERTLAALEIGRPQKATQWFDLKEPPEKRYRGPHPNCIRSLLKGVEQGQRNEALIRVACYFRNFRGVTRKRTLVVLRLFNEKNMPPLSEEELLRTLKSAEDNKYVYGCNDPIFKARCKGKDDCPLRKEEDRRVVYIPFMELPDGRLAEEAFDGEDVFFLVYDPETDQVEKKSEIRLEDRVVKPVDNTEVRTQQVLMPSDIEEYESEELLSIEITQFLNDWHEPPDELFRKKDLAYVRLTYVQDLVPQVPYRRLLCDWGRGKDAWLDALGSICYRPIFLAGSDTDKSIVRKLNNWRGTALINEADFSNSTLYSFITKILNLSFDRRKGWYFRSSEDEMYGVLGYYVYCCKLLATRARYKDMALESRCLTDIGRENIKDIPLFRIDKFNQQALCLRNKLTLWRFRNYFSVKERSSCLEDKDLARKVFGDSEEMRNISSRVKQIILPLWLIADKHLREELVELAKKVQGKLLAQDWRHAFELQAKEAIRRIWKEDQKATEAIIDAEDRGIYERGGEAIPKYETKIEERQFDGEKYYGIALSTISRKMIILAGTKEDEIERKMLISNSKQLRNICESRLGFGFQIGKKNRRLVLIPSRWMDDLVNVNDVVNVLSEASPETKKKSEAQSVNSELADERSVESKKKEKMMEKNKPEKEGSPKHINHILDIKEIDNRRCSGEKTENTEKEKTTSSERKGARYYLIDAKSEGRAVILRFQHFKSGQTLEIRDSDYRPYFLLPYPLSDAEETRVRGLHGEVEVVEKRDLFTDKMRKWTRVNFRTLEAFRGSVKTFKNTWEAEIEYVQSYMYDRNIVFGAPYTIVEDQPVLITTLPQELEGEFERVFEKIRIADPPKYALIKHWFSLLHQPVPQIQPECLGFKEVDSESLYRAFMLARIANIPIGEAYQSRRVSDWLKSIVYTYLRRNNILIPTSKELRRGLELRRVPGALTVQPKAGVYFNTIICDFESLYPSCIDSYNLSYETVDCLHEGCKNNRINECPEHWVCNKRRGFYSLLIGALKDLRIHWFKPFSKDKVIAEQERRNAEALAKLLKLITVSSYGVTVRIHGLACPPLAECITGHGRWALRTTWNIAEAEGLHPIYGDTDSVFLNDPEPSQVEWLVKKVKEKLRLDLAIEKRYSLCVLPAAKKAYFGILPDGRPDIKGLTAIKSNSPKFIQKVFQDCVKELSGVKTLEGYESAKKRIFRVFLRVTKELKQHNIRLEDLVYSVKLNSDPKERSDVEMTPQPYQCAIQLLDRGEKVDRYDTVHFIKVNPFNYKGKTFTVKPTEHVKSLEEINVEDYIRNLTTALQQTFSQMGIKPQRKQEAKITDWFEK